MNPASRKFLFRLGGVLLAAALAVVLIVDARARGRNAPAERIVTTQWPVMGTIARLEVKSNPSDRLDDIRTRVQTTYTRLERLLSAWDPQSELSRLAAAGCTNWLAAVSSEVRPCYAAALRLMEESHGAFNPYLGARLRALGMGRKGVYSDFDLGAIAKGFAVDRAAQHIATLSLRGTDPRQTGTDPRHAGTDPGQNWRGVSDTSRQSAEKGGTDPRQTGTGPRGMGTDPRTMGTDPRTMGTDPGKMGTGPGKMGTGPGKMGTDPGKMGTDPGKLPSILIDLGGNLRVMGTDPWRTGIRNPFKAQTASAPPFCASIVLTNGESVATSGNYERFAIKDGKRVSHILDGRTGEPVSGIAGVTVITPASYGALLADGLSTTLFVLGIKEGTRFLNEHYPLARALWIPDTPEHPTLVVPHADLAQRLKDVMFPVQVPETK